MAAPKSIPHPPAFEPDERQREAIEHLYGPILVVAGAGTGKTTVLTRRIAHLIRECGVRPDQILALTYTDNAAREMRERVQSELGSKAHALQVATFHAYCNNLLIRNGKQFDVLDDCDLWIYLRKRLRELNLKYFIIPAKVGKFLHDLLDFMRRCHDELVAPEKYASYVQQLERGELPIPRVGKSKDADALTDEEVLGRCREISRVFTQVESMLRDENLGTFGHMITRAHDLLRADASLVAREREHARFILVDEFQDANFAQVKVLQNLAGADQNVFAVGDPDQAIYRFRGASSEAFSLFQRHFLGLKVVALEKNRRSTTPILRAAHALISKNPDFSARVPGGVHFHRAPLTSAREEDAARAGKTLLSFPVEGVILGPKDRDLESSDVATLLRQRRRESRCDWKDLAVLYRQHLHRNELVAELLDQNIPFSIENMDVMDTPEARDLFACLGAVVSVRDDASLFRVAAFPQFTIAPEELRAGIRSRPRDQGPGAVTAVLEQITGGAAVLNALQKLRDEIATSKAKSRAAVEIIARRFGFDRASPALTALLEFVQKWEDKRLTSSGHISELLEYLEYFREAGGTIPMSSPEADAVRLMTVHTAKGLEFDHVSILRANSGSFPAAYKESLVEFPHELRDPESAGPEDDKTLYEQEERRLFYVAMTRARDSLTIYAKAGTGKTDPTPPGYLRGLLKDPGLHRYLRQRPPRGFQTDIFAQSAPTPVGVAAWAALPAASDLSAHLSASAVQTYETCPLQFKLQREWKIPREAPAAMQYGASIHRVLRAYYDSVRSERPMTEDALIELFRNDLTDARLQDDYQHELYDKQGIAQLHDFFIQCESRPLPKVLHTEEPFEVKIGSATVAGRIDRMDQFGDAVVITDYKTGKPQSQEDADQSLQLSIYAMAAREKWGYHVAHLSFYNLAENASVITRRDNLQLEEAQRKVEDVALSIAAGHFEPKTGFHCGFCPYRSLCPATEKRLSTPPTDKKTNRDN